MDKLQGYEKPSTINISETNYGGGAGIVYNPSSVVGLGFYFDGVKGDITELRTSAGIDLKLPVSEVVAPILGLRVGWTGITYQEDGWDYLHLSPHVGLDIGKKYGGYFIIGYNVLSELRGTNKDYKFDSTLSYILGARIGLF